MCGAALQRSVCSQLSVDLSVDRWWTGGQQAVRDGCGSSEGAAFMDWSSAPPEQVWRESERWGGMSGSLTVCECVGVEEGRGDTPQWILFYSVKPEPWFWAIRGHLLFISAMLESANHTAGHVLHTWWGCSYAAWFGGGRQRGGCTVIIKQDLDFDCSIVCIFALLGYINWVFHLKPEPEADLLCRSCWT